MRKRECVWKLCILDDYTTLGDGRQPMFLMFSNRRYAYTFMVNGNRYKINRPLACIVEFKSPSYITYIIYIIYDI